MTNSPEEIHAAYCEETKTSPTYRIHERSYADFISTGFTADDMRLVLRHVIRENRRMNGATYSMRLDRLLDFEYRHFDALLSEAKGREKARPKSKTESEKVIELFRKSSAPEVDHAPKIIGEVLRKIGGVS